MEKRIVAGVLALAMGLTPGVALAQRPQPSKPPTAPAAPPVTTPTQGSESAEIKLDENTTLKATALEARMAAVLANVALLQRQYQDLQQEWSKMLEERKKLIGDAARKANVEVKDPNDWVLDNSGQRYVYARRTPPAPAPPTR